MMQHIGWAVIAVITLVLLGLLGRLVEVLPAGEVMVIQFPSGQLQAYTQPGIYAQWLGTATHYPVRESYEIDQQEIFFADGATAKLTGNVQFDVPSDPQTLLAMHAKFRSPEAVMAKLIAPAAIKALNASGSLMSSREAYAERRSELQHDIDDQMAHGTWQLRVTTVTEPDPLDPKTTKILKKGEIVLDSKGKAVRYEESPLDEYNVKTFGLTIAKIDYDDKVKAQIQQQQEITMQVQTSIANARRAEQDALTAKSEGEAKAAKAKWDQEAVKATEVTQAEKRLAVAQLDAQAAEQTKRATILKGEGEAEARKLAINADNALTQRIDAFKFESEKRWAAFAAYKGPPLVPSIVFGGGAGTGGNIGVADFMNLMSAESAKRLNLDMNMAAPAGK